MKDTAYAESAATAPSGGKRLIQRPRPGGQLPFTRRPKTAIAKDTK